MARPLKYNPGDLVFAKVKGYPPWPARVTSRKSTQYKIFFYGTHEKAGLKRESIWPYTKENLEKFGPSNKHRQFYSEGLIEIEETPEIAPCEDVGTLDDTGPMNVSHNSPKTPVAASTPAIPVKTQTPTPLKRTKAVSLTPETTTPTRGRGVAPETTTPTRGRGETSTPTRGRGATSTPTRGRGATHETTTPSRASGATHESSTPTRARRGTTESTTPTRARGITTETTTPTRARGTTTEANTPTRAGGAITEANTPTRERGRKRKAIDSSDDDPSKNTLNENDTRSRRGRPGKSRKDDLLPASNDIGTFTKRKTPKKVAVVAPYEVSTPTTVWIKVKSTGELMEINLDEEPKFVSEKQKLECERTLDINAKDFKLRIKAGEFEEIKNLQSKRKNQLSKYEKDLLDILGLGEKAELEKQKNIVEKENMLGLIRTEKKIVDLDVILKKTLLSETPDLEACKKALDELNSLPMTQLMLKKLSPFVNTICCFKEYRGLKGGVNVEKTMKEVQQRVEKVWRRILNLFQFKEHGDRCFQDEFFKLAEEFKQKTKGMEEKELIRLITDPTVTSMSF